MVKLSTTACQTRSDVSWQDCPCCTIGRLWVSLMKEVLAWSFRVLVSAPVLGMSQLVRGINNYRELPVYVAQGVT